MTASGSWGRTKGKIGFHGGKVTVRRPRVRSYDGRELALPTWCRYVASDRASFSRLSSRSIAKAHTRAAAVLFDEFNTCFPEHGFYAFQRFIVSRIAPNLDIRDRVPMQARRLREIPNRPIQGRSSHSHLCACHRHCAVLLSHVHLTQERKAVMSASPTPHNRKESLRRAFIGGSDARVIMGNDESALQRIWREKRGELEPQDHSGNLLVQLGVATEHLNRQWYERAKVVKDVQSWVRQLPRWTASSKAPARYSKPNSCCHGRSRRRQRRRSTWPNSSTICG